MNHFGEKKNVGYRPRCVLKRDWRIRIDFMEFFLGDDGNAMTVRGVFMRNRGFKTL
jgi:hypothetical protein